MFLDHQRRDAGLCTVQGETLNLFEDFRDLVRGMLAGAQAKTRARRTPHRHRVVLPMMADLACDKAGSERWEIDHIGRSGMYAKPMTC